MSARNRLALGLGLVLTLASGAVRSEDTAMHGFLDRVHKDAEGKEAKYVLFVPHGYKADTPSPLILFLHGAGETGTDGQKQATVGLGPAIKKREKSFPFVSVFPQSQKRTWAAGTPDADRALAILAEVEKNYKVDPKRIYLTGLSMGGFGTWSLAAKVSGRWAAIAPICGGGDSKAGELLKGTPCWCFHGGDDKVVPARLSRNMMKAMWAAGATPNYTEYPGVGHNSWDKAYGTNELYEWFLGHTLK